MIQLIIVHSHFRGERAAAVMETQLTALERKIDDLLASVDVDSAGKDTIMNHQEQSHKEQPQP